MITIKDLAGKYNMDEKKLRRILRTNNVRKRQYQWKWRSGTKGLKQVEDIISRYLEN